MSTFLLFTIIAITFVVVLAVALRPLRAPEHAARWDRYLHTIIAAGLGVLVVLVLAIAHLLSMPVYGCGPTAATRSSDDADLKAIRKTLHQDRKFSDLYVRAVHGRQLVLVDRRWQRHAGWYSNLNGPRRELLSLWAITYRRNHPKEEGPVNIAIAYPDGSYLVGIAPADCVSS